MPDEPPEAVAEAGGGVAATVEVTRCTVVVGMVVGVAGVVVGIVVAGGGGMVVVVVVCAASLKQRLRLMECTIGR